MGIFHSRSSSNPVPDEEEGGYPNLQNEYKSNGYSSETSLKILLAFGSIYKATRAILQKLSVVFHYSGPTKTADPLLPIQDPLVEPLLAPPPPICSPSSHSIFKITHGSLTDEEAHDQFANAPDNEIIEKTVVGIIKSREEEKEEEVVKRIIKSREEETEGEVVKRSIVVVEKQSSLLPSQDPLLEPLLAPPPPIFSPSSHSIFKITFGSLTDEKADDQFANAPDNEFVEETAGIIKSREEEREGEVVKRSIVVPVVKKSTVVVEKEKSIKHYSSHHRILLVGEGDFSFSASLAVAFGSAANITATSLDSEAFLKKNYGKAMSNIAELRRRGSKVMHEIDATQIANHELLRHVKFDRIIFNFPYAGLLHNLSKESQLRCHRKLVSRFLMNAKKMISENGEIHITHKTNGFHAKFRVICMASSNGLRLIEAVEFNRSDYPGYNTKCGFGGDNNFNCNPSQTYKFGLKTVAMMIGEDNERWIKYYSSAHNILLVGDGDFSFSLCLGLSFGSATNIVATSLDTYDVLLHKYKDAKANLMVLGILGATVLHGVDATRMMTHPELQLRKFHRIIYNFPHAGFHRKEANPAMVMMHRELVRGFLQNASSMLDCDGEIHVTHKTTTPFDSWKIEDLGSECSLVCIAQDEFRIQDYPGYENKRGASPRPDEPFRLGACKTYRFRLAVKNLNTRKKQYKKKAHA